MKRRNVWITFSLLVVLVAAVGYIDWPGTPNLKLGNITKSFDLRLGLDLQGGTSLMYEADVNQVPSSDRTSALEGVRDVIERRINAYGVSEPVIQTSRVGSQYRVSVDLAGVKDINEAIKLIGETPLLEFREPAAPTGLSDADAKKKADEVQALAKRPRADFTALAKQYSDDTGSKDNGGDLGWAQSGQFVAEFDKALFQDLHDGELTSAPVKTQFGYHIIKRIESRKITVDGKEVTEIHGAHILIGVLDSPINQNNYVTTALTGKQLKRSDVVFDPNSGAPQVQLTFNSEGAKLFGELTKKNLGKSLAIYLDGAPISIPTVQNEITSGTAVITGNFTLEEAKQLAKRLNAGALPVPITLISQQNVGATLGRESIERSLVAGFIGLVLVAIFMIVFYRLPGVLAVVALGVYTLIVLAIFKLWPVTLSLAGIAGFILSIGMAVDANILVFERTKEELQAGRPLLSAIDEGFRRAWLSIRDSNVSSLITAFILIWFGSSLIKGFAVTLSIGILVSMFSALTVTRTFLHLSISGWMSRHLWLFGVSRSTTPLPPSHV
ncbi:MAG: protein translocase subunit SecD [Candidatus Kerfeldbacteria bacterium]|nr:protein translocase subunit SecD [Candidatus Kerfeldbacteria bacterium]